MRARWWLLQSHLNGGLDPSGVLIELVVPTLHSIGERWASGEVSVAEEHRATAVAQRVVGHLGLQFGRRGKDRGTVALAAPIGGPARTPRGDRRRSSALAGIRRGRAGWNVPADAVGDAVAQEDRLLAVGIVSTVSGLESEVASAAGSVRTSVPGIPLLIGGGAVPSEAHARALGADLWTGPGSNAAVEAVERIAGSAEARAQRSVA